MNLIAQDLGFFDSICIPLEEPIKDNQLVSPGDPKGRSSVTREEGKLLAALCAGRKVLEIGTGLGVSTCCIASLADLVVSVDPDPWVREHVKTPANVIRVERISDAAPLRPYDVVFIDGEHDHESVLRDIRDSTWALKKGGVVAFHDLSQIAVRLAVEGSSSLFSNVGSFETCGKLTIGVLA